MRVRIGLAAFIALAAQASLPAMPVVPLDSPLAFMLVVQQVVIGVTLGFAVRVVFAAVEFAGELIGLQMGLNFAGFFDPVSAATGHRHQPLLRHHGGVAVHRQRRPPAGDRGAGAELRGLSGRARALAFLKRRAAAALGQRDLRAGPVDRAAAGGHAAVRQPGAGVISRVARRSTSSRSAFPITLGVGLLGMLLTLPAMQQPFTVALERMLSFFR
jgi:flagellar biosynthetic protein FliR